MKRNEKRRRESTLTIAIAVALISLAEAIIRLVTAILDR